MAVALVGGAALGAAFGELLKVVVHRTNQTARFGAQLKRLEITLKRVEPVFNEITVLSKVLERPDDETAEFTRYLEQGTELVVKCLRIKCWNVRKKYRYTKKLIRLDEELLRFFQIEALANVAKTTMMNLIGTNELNDKFDRLHLTGGGFLGSCNVPGLPEFIVGLDQHLTILKRTLLKDDTRLLVISAPGGFGKTTLAKMLCHDPEIKGIFDANILYVTVSTESSLMSIAQSLFKHYGIHNSVFRSEEDAKNQIENLVIQKGSGNMLLVLDDASSGSESVIRHLKFRIPGYKILVTSRNLFPEFNSTYDLITLNDKDAETLFRHHAFTGDEIHVSVELVNKVVEFCKGVPLALTVVGASLRGRPEVIWTTTLEKWSEGHSVLESHQQLLLCLQTSIDALDELHKNCFMDLGLFPEDDQIAGTTLMDMWVELYKLDDKGMGAGTNLFNLSSRNLINLVQIRRVAGERDGHCSQYRVMQHDVLRDLAIYLSRQEPEAKRKRLFTEIHSNKFPEWWTQQPVDARILSISTDGEFNSTWDDLNAPNVEVLILNIRSEHYTLPCFIEKMSQLKVLIVTGYGGYPTQLNNLQVLASLSKLSRIRFEHVSVSPSIQVIFTLKTLKKLTFVMCKIGEALNSDTTGSAYTLENLKEFEIDLCYDLKQLPARLCGSSRLKKLIITNCQELDALPEELGNLSSLEILVLHCCTKLKELPESIGSLHKLNIIDISDCSHISVLPKQIGELSNLRTIDISRCEGLEKLPKSLAELKQLKDVICDEERSYLWKDIASDHSQVKMSFVEEDRIGNLKKICR
ncbi:hypothetical protein M8C21_030471 [Ambrosia artemisiifolia]|uniref:RPW8 domain-containing protein n=1 Tax=Ambrosia artemisiifolia TaxID=4212 RepID=A0AAD5GGH5_AMBAR|nr:hypothetical protein M8C21_030471 [Ambrosia artemisiifolia]